MTRRLHYRGKSQLLCIPRTSLVQAHTNAMSLSSKVPKMHGRDVDNISRDGRGMGATNDADEATTACGHSSPKRHKCDQVAHSDSETTKIRSGSTLTRPLRIAIEGNIGMNRRILACFHKICVCVRIYRMTSKRYLESNFWFVCIWMWSSDGKINLSGCAPRACSQC